MPEYETNETYHLAAILDPRFKLRWCDDDEERQRLTNIIKEVAKIEAENHHAQMDENIDVNDEPPSTKSKNLFSFMAESNIHISGSKTQFKQLMFVMCNYSF